MVKEATKVILPAGAKVGRRPSIDDTKRFSDLLKTMEIANLGCPDEVVFVYDTDSVLDVLNKMVKMGVSALPVVENHALAAIKVMDWVSLLDIAYFMADLAVATQSMPVHYASPTNDLSLKDAIVATVCAREGRLTTIVEEMSEDYVSVLDVVRSIVSHNAGRVLINAEDGSMKTIATQTQVLKLVADHLDLLQRHSLLTLEELGLTKKPATTVNEMSTGIHAIRMLDYEKSSAVAVCTDTGRCTGVVSGRGMEAIFFSRELSYETRELYDKLPEFLNKLYGGKKYPHLRATSTFGEAVRAFADYGLDHICVVDAVGRPVSMLDPSRLLGTMLMSATEA